MRLPRSISPLRIFTDFAAFCDTCTMTPRCVIGSRAHAPVSSKDSASTGADNNSTPTPSPNNVTPGAPLSSNGSGFHSFGTGNALLLIVATRMSTLPDNALST
jgi:hypothetical protein